MMKYEKSAPDKALRQGELLSNVVEVIVNVNTIYSEELSLEQRTHPFAYVVSQDCDLDWDFHARKSQTQNHRIIPNVLLCEAMLATDLARQLINVEGSKDSNKSRIWARVKINKDERFHFFQRVTETDDLTSNGVPELGIDFKRHFTIPTEELYTRIQYGQTMRRCRLLSPYMEHLSDRFAYFLSRIALPEDHESESEIIKRDQDNT